MKKIINNKKILCIETNIIYNSIREASKQLDISSSNICQCLSGRNHTAGGYHWEYVEE